MKTWQVLVNPSRGRGFYSRDTGSLKECAMSVNTVIQLVYSGIQGVEECIQGKTAAEGRQTEGRQRLCS